MPANGTARYLVRAQAGQSMTLKLATPQGKAILVVTGVNGTVLVPERLNLVEWTGQLPLMQDYVIDVKPVGGNATYSLQVTIPPLETPTPEPSSPPKRISFAPGGTSSTAQGNLAANAIDTYVLRAFAGQTMTVIVTSTQTKMLLSISGADGQPYKTMGAGTSSFSMQLPATQDYFIAIATETGAPANYNLQISIPPIATPDPRAQPKRISFAPGGTSATVQGTLTDVPDLYVLRALASQIMSVVAWASPGQVSLMIYAADGTILLPDSARATSATGNLPATQDYFIQVRSVGPSAMYTMQVTIPPLNLEPKRITFPAGGTSTSIDGTIAPNMIARYVVRALAGQTMTVKLSSVRASIYLRVWSADGEILIPDSADLTNWVGKLPANQDYIIDVWSAANTDAGYQVQITIPPK